VSGDHAPVQRAIALHDDDGEALWFMGALATVKASAEQTGGRVSVIHHLAPAGSGSPLHVHHRENEWFYILGGELTIWVGGEEIRAPAGSFVFGPQGSPHTFMVSSAGPARFLLVTEPGGFDAFMRACAEPAGSRTVPPPAAPADPGHVAAIAAEYGIDILGPPGIPPRRQ
jgi:mannose-6-phosphate isomerase-like protein (cupin superfamily)